MTLCFTNIRFSLSYGFRYSTDRWTLYLVQKVSFLFNYFTGKKKKTKTFSGIGGFGERKKMKRTVMDNAIRSSVVVLGSLAFGYLSLELGYKPFLEKAEQYERSLQSSQQHQQQGLVFSLCLSLSIALLMFHFRRDRFLL